MSHDLLYLRRDIQIEPLVDRWYAWPHLIPPATAARNLTHRHFQILDSYLAAPAEHAAAAKNPQMIGGPFVAYEGREGEIRELRERTARDRASLVELSGALEALDELLQTAPTGQSLTPLYASVPAAIRGYVELWYDNRDHASFRLLEPLLYRSHYYNRTGQSLLLSVTAGDDRPFVLSTPRLSLPGTVHLPWSFDDARLESLYRLTQTPQPWGDIVTDLGCSYEEAIVFRTFLTAEPPPRYVPYTGTGVRWRYFGHACILIETRDLSILFDPALSYSYQSDIPRYTYADLPERIDYAIITHAHMDHVLLETMLQLRHKIGCVLVPRSGPGLLQDPSLRLILEHIGFTNVEEVGELDSIEVPGGALTAIPFLGEHADLAVASKLAYVLRLGREQLLFAADSCNVDPCMYRHVHAAVGNVGTLFLGMECVGAPMTWLYGPLMLRPVDRAANISRRLSGSDFQQGRALVDQFGCHSVYVYAMGQEPWLNHIMSLKYTEASAPIVESNRLIDYCRERALVAERLFGEKEILIDRLWC
ncbi:MAG: MBL fold metallo-hydrolase [Vicinamibacterales bacterium]